MTSGSLLKTGNKPEGGKKREKTKSIRKKQTCRLQGYKNVTGRSNVFSEDLFD